MPKQYVEILPSAARTATPSDVVIDTHPGVLGVRLFIDVTAAAATPSMTPEIIAVDPVTGVEETLISGVAITGTGETVLEVWPGATAAANTRANEILGVQTLFRFTHADADSLTYSAHAEFF